MRPRIPVEVRIGARTVPQGECTIFTGGYAGRSGHVLIWDGDRMVGVHRAAWIAVHGPVPPGLVVRHSCDVPRCVNPEHLLLGTVADNNRDAQERGRHVPSRGSANGFSKLTESDVVKIRARLRSGQSKTAIAREFNVSRFPIYAIASGKLWAHVGESLGVDR